METLNKKLQITAIDPAEVYPGDLLTLHLSSVPNTPRLTVWFGNTRVRPKQMESSKVLVEVPQLSTGTYSVWVSYIHLETNESTGLEVSSNRVTVSVPLRIFAHPQSYRLTHPLNPTARLNVVAVPLIPTPSGMQKLTLYLEGEAQTYSTERVLRTTLNLDAEGELRINRHLVSAFGEKGAALSIHALLRPITAREWVLIDPHAGIFRIVLVDHRYVVYYGLKTSNAQGLVAFSVGDVPVGSYKVHVSVNDVMSILNDPPDIVTISR